MDFVRRHKREALVLVGVLWIVVLMIIITAVVGQASRIDTRVSLVGAEHVRCKWACRAGLETAIFVLGEDERDSDSLVDLWSDNPEDFNDVSLDSVKFSVEVIDEASKLNINTATKEQLMELPDMTEEVADSILDWRDSDDQERQAGAEAGYYLNLPYGYEPRNSDFETIRELLLVRDVTEGLLYGNISDENVSDYNEGWVNYLTCYSYDTNKDAEGNDRVNVNTASEADLVEKLGIRQSQAKWIVENRQFDSLAGLLEQEGQGGGPNQNNQADQPNQNNQDDQGGQNNQSSQQNTGVPTVQPSPGNNQGQQIQAEPLDLETFYEIVDKITVSDESRVQGRVNVNTASFFVMTALLEGEKAVAEEIISYRDGLSGGIVSLAELKNINSMTIDIARKYIDLVTTRSDVFTVRSTATAHTTGFKSTLETVVERTDSSAKVIYYRSGAGV